MIQVHANTYRNIVRKASQEMTGFSWHNKSDHYSSFSAKFQFKTSITDWADRNKLKDGYVEFIGNYDRKREAEALLRLWLVENGYKYELVKKEITLDYFVTVNGERQRAKEVRTVGIKITHIPAQTERSAS